MDWDWEEGPPRDVPRRRPEDPSQSPAPDDSSTFSDAIEHFERPSAPEPTGEPQRPGAGDEPPYFDDDRTQIIRRPQQVSGDVPGGAAADADRPAGGTPDLAPEPGSFTEALNYFEAATPARPASRPDLERPRLRTIEAAQRGAAADAADRRYDDQRPQSRTDRTARRAQRRRQIRRRRLTALAVLVVIIVLLVVLVVRGCGGTSGGQTAALARSQTAATRTASVVVVAGRTLTAYQAGPRESDHAHPAVAAGTRAAETLVAGVTWEWHQPPSKETQ